MSFTGTKCGNRNSGVALISVLIVVAMVSASASWVMKSQHVSVQRMTRVIGQEQAMVHAFGGEIFIPKMFERDKKTKQDYYTTWHPINDKGDRVGDALAELWSRPWTISTRNFEKFGDTRELDSVDWSFCVHDARALIDLNMLHRGLEQPESRKPDNLSWSKHRFMETVLLNLFANAHLGPEDDPDTPTPRQLLNTLKDWFDKDDSPREDSWESSEYVAARPSYRTAEMRMAWPDEIYLVRGFNENTAHGFFHVLTALPYTFEEEKELNHKINLNTAPAEVLAALPGLDKISNPDQDIVAGILTYRRSDEAPLTNVQELKGLVMGELACIPIKDVTDKDLQAVCNFWRNADKHLAVTSDVFEVAVKIRTGDIENEMQVLAHRNKNGKVRVFHRRFGNGYYARCERLKRGNVKWG